MEQPSKIPITRLKKDELIWLATHYCEHGHTYLEHYSCYKPDREEKIGFFDIEASNLDADFGIMLSYCIKTRGKKEFFEGTVSKSDIVKAAAGDEDKRLVQQAVRDILRYDRVVGYYSTRFDIPFLRTRALSCGVEFPFYGSVKHTDLYFVVKNKFKLSRNRLENACRALVGKTEKTRIENRYWRGGMRGDRESLRYILDHNRKDVIDLERLYERVVNYGRRTDRSI